MDRLVLVDAGNLAYRAHFAYRGLSYKGQPTGILFGFLEMLKSIRSSAGDRIVFCWDYGIPGRHKNKGSWRKKVYPEYKANRKRDPSIQKAHDLQVPVLCRVLRGLGYKNVGAPMLEADDVIGLGVGATLQPVVIVSGDQDLRQLLVFRDVTILHPKGWRTVTPEKAETELGFPVEHIPSYLTLGGDCSDNIRPAPRVFGPKTAKKMILAGVDPSVDEPDGVWLKQFPQLLPWQRVQICHRVACIPTRQEHLPKFARCSLGFDFSSYVRGKPNVRGFLQFCTQYGMKTLIQERRRFL